MVDWRKVYSVGSIENATVKNLVLGCQYHYNLDDIEEQHLNIPIKLLRVKFQSKIGNGNRGLQLTIILSTYSR